MDQATLPRYRYTVDPQDVITSVCPLWLAFARENGATQLTREAVVGRSLWDFIAGDETQQLYRTLLQRVRARNASTVVPFRCDSPTLRRYMRLELTPEPNGSVQFDGVLERVEQTVPYNLLDQNFPRSMQMLTLCSCCKRILMENYGWLEIGAVAERLDLLNKNIAPKLRHSLCPECLTVATRESHPQNHGQTTATLCN
jgi:hypothetical protein